MPDPDEHPSPTLSPRSNFLGFPEDTSDECWSEHFERPTALLTDKQRRFLAGVFEYTGEHERQERYGMRQRIRSRYLNGLLDLGYLRALSDESSDAVIDELGESSIQQIAVDLLEFVYIQTEKQDLLNKIHETAVYNVLTGNPELRESAMAPGDVEVTTSVQYPPNIDEISQRAEEMGLDALRPEEIGYLVQHKRIEPEKLRELYELSRSGEIFEGVETLDTPVEDNE